MAEGNVQEPQFFSRFFQPYTNEFYRPSRFIFAFLAGMHGAQKAFLLWDFPAGAKEMHLGPGSIHREWTGGELRRHGATRLRRNRRPAHGTDAAKVNSRSSTPVSIGIIGRMMGPLLNSAFTLPN